MVNGPGTPWTMNWTTFSRLIPIPTGGRAKLDRQGSVQWGKRDATDETRLMAVPHKFPLDCFFQVWRLREVILNTGWKWKMKPVFIPLILYCALSRCMVFRSSRHSSWPLLAKETFRCTKIRSGPRSRGGCWCLWEAGKQAVPQAQDEIWEVRRGTAPLPQGYLWLTQVRSSRQHPCMHHPFHPHAAPPPSLPSFPVYLFYYYFFSRRWFFWKTVF